MLEHRRSNTIKYFTVRTRTSAKRLFVLCVALRLRVRALNHKRFAPFPVLLWRATGDGYGWQRRACARRPTADKRPENPAGSFVPFVYKRVGIAQVFGYSPIRFREANHSAVRECIDRAAVSGTFAKRHVRNFIRVMIL